MRRLVIAAAITAAAIASGSAEARSAMTVPLDQARKLSFAKPVSTLYVGNPAIADVVVIDNRHALVQGKAFGNTDVIALDSAGQQISNQHVIVARKTAASSTATSGIVTLQRGREQTTYACAGNRCRPSQQPAASTGAAQDSTASIPK